MINFDNSALDYILIPTAVAEKLLIAPEGCLKLYLYGRMHKEADRDEMLGALEMSPAKFAECVDYLQRSGFITVTMGDTTRICYTDAQKKGKMPVMDMYADAEYNNTLQQLFGTRMLKHTDLKTLYECSDLFGLPRTVVLMLVEHMVIKHGKKVPMSFISREAMKWVRTGILTAARAQDYINTSDVVKEHIIEVLKAIGMPGIITPEAESLYIKWTREWGLSESAISKGAQTTAARANSPSLAYLDKVLENYHKKQLLTASDICKSEQEFRTATANAKRMLKEAGIEKRVSASDKELYAKLITWGMDDETIMYAAQRSRGYASPIKVLEMITDEWHEKGVTTLESAKAVVEAKVASDYIERHYTDEELRGKIYDTLMEMDD